MGLFDQAEKGLGLFANSGLATLVSPKVQAVAETAAGLTRTAAAGLQDPPQQGAPQGKPLVQANVAPVTPAQKTIGGFVRENKGPLMIAVVVLVGFFIVKKVL